MHSAPSANPVTSHHPTEEPTRKDSSNSEDKGLPDKREDERRHKQEGNHCEQLAWEHVLAVMHEGA